MLYAAITLWHWVIYYRGRSTTSWYFSYRLGRLLDTLGTTAKPSRPNHTLLGLLWLFYCRLKYFPSLASEMKVDLCSLNQVMLTGRIKCFKGSASSFYSDILDIATNTYHGLMPTLVGYIQYNGVCVMSPWLQRILLWPRLIWRNHLPQNVIITLWGPAVLSLWCVMRFRSPQHE